MQQNAGPGGGHADPTAVMPPVPPRPEGTPQPDGPHPWQSQLQAARDRNEQTQVQYLDPSQDPLRRRPQRQQPQQPPRHQQQYPQQQQQQPQQYRQQPQQQQYQPQPQQQQYQPQQQRQQYAPPQQPQQPQQPAQRAPREPRQRNANPMKIPGLGCLKGCLFTLVLLFVASWLIWELTPLKDWIGQGQSYWHAITDAFDTVTGWISKLGGDSGDSGGSGT